MLDAVPVTSLHASSCHSGGKNPRSCCGKVTKASGLALEKYELVCDAMIAYANDPKHESILIDDQKVTAAFHNTGGVRDSADSGDFTYRDLIKVLPFDNTYCIAKLTNGQFDTWNNSSNYYKGSKGNGKYTYVATINYLADNPDYSPSEKVFNTNIVIQDIFIEYLESNDGSF